MINEDIRTSLVHRADYVAEQEELDHLIRLVNSELSRVRGFIKLSSFLSNYEEFRRDYYV